MFEKKQLAKKAVAPLAGAYVGYIVLNNLNLQINTVGFYQISKIAVAPAGEHRFSIFATSRESLNLLDSSILPSLWHIFFCKEQRSAMTP